MDFALTDEQDLLRQTVSKLLDATSPVSRLRDLRDDPVGFDRDVWAQGSALGWAGLLVPEAIGGGAVSDRPLLDAAIVAEEMGRVLHSTPFFSTSVVALALASDDTSRHESVLASLASGAALATWCLGEGHGWDPARSRLQATRSSGGWTLTGSKAPVPDAHVADHLLVTARAGDDLVQLLVPAGAQGVGIRPLAGLDLGRRFSTVTFDGVTVGEEALVGAGEGAAALVERQLQVALVLQCAETVGVMDRVFELTLEYAKDRVSFGRPIGSYQAIKHDLSDLYLSLEGAKAAAVGAARAVQSGAAEAASEVSVAKTWIAPRAVDLVQQCIHIHGGIGVTWEHDLHLYLRRAAANHAVYGAPAWHRERLCSLLAA